MVNKIFLTFHIKKKKKKKENQHYMRAHHLLTIDA